MLVVLFFSLLVVVHWDFCVWVDEVLEENFFYLGSVGFVGSLNLLQFLSDISHSSGEKVHPGLTINMPSTCS